MFNSLQIEDVTS